MRSEQEIKRRIYLIEQEKRLLNLDGIKVNNFAIHQLKWVLGEVE